MEKKPCAGGLTRLYYKNTIIAIRNNLCNEVIMSCPVPLFFTAGTVPVLAGSCETSNAMDVELSGDYAYVVDSTEGIVIIDVSDPANVDNDSRVLTIAEPPEEIVVRGRYIYAAYGSSGFKIIELGP
jgi:hypothetical protein